MIIWLTGLSGAGNTTVGRRVYERIKSRHPQTVFLDGDILRDVWGDRLRHDLDGRRANAGRITRLCRMLDAQGIHVVASILSVFPDDRRENRTIFSKYYEAFLDTPFDEVVRRDSKGLYRAAQAGEVKNVVGVDLPYPMDETWDMRIAAPEIFESPDVLAEKIYRAVEGDL
jgi:adenylylsulfate kinase-like enzyme